MEKARRHLVWSGLAGALTTLLLIFLIGVAVAYSGVYDISASRGHTAGMRWFLDTTMQSSVRSHAGEADADQLARADATAGAAEYKAMCEQCHGGPGVDPAPFSRGMLPRPPHLTEAATEWEPAEVFWIVRHGVKYTGMPAFGEDHDDDTLWNIAAFVEDLPAMTPATYRELDGSGGRDHAATGADSPSADHDHAHDHAH
jgi:mono/diheme cytochrome c family protein